MEPAKLIIHKLCNTPMFLVFSTCEDIDMILLKDIATLDGIIVPYPVDICPICNFKILNNDCLLWDENTKELFNRHKQYEDMIKFQKQIDNYLSTQLLTLSLYTK